MQHGMERELSIHAPVSSRKALGRGVRGWQQEGRLVLCPDRWGEHPAPVWAAGSCPRPTARPNAGVALFAAGGVGGMLSIRGSCYGNPCEPPSAVDGEGEALLPW